MAAERRRPSGAPQRPPTSVARGSLNRSFESSDPERQREATDTQQPQQSAPKEPDAVPSAAARRPRRGGGVGRG